MTFDLFDDSVEQPQENAESSIYYHYQTFTQGAFILAASNDGLCALGFPNTNPDIFFKNIKLRFPEGQLTKSESPFTAIIEQLDEYFSGHRETFDLPLELIGTKFQLRVWEYLLTISYGQTQSYKQVAKAIKSNPRAVGRAIGDNPVPIIIPCHRVIGSDGKLTGYGGGLWRKEWLLQLEREVSRKP